MLRKAESFYTSKLPTFLFQQLLEIARDTRSASLFHARQVLAVTLQILLFQRLRILREIALHLVLVVVRLQSQSLLVAEQTHQHSLSLHALAQSLDEGSEAGLNLFRQLESFCVATALTFRHQLFE